MAYVILVGFVETIKNLPKRLLTLWNGDKKKFFETLFNIAATFGITFAVVWAITNLDSL